MRIFGVLFRSQLILLLIFDWFRIFLVSVSHEYQGISWPLKIQYMWNDIVIVNRKLVICEVVEKADKNWG